MNRERVQQLRDHMAGLPEDAVNMDAYLDKSPTCGTVACVAGYACLLFDSESPQSLIDAVNREEGYSFFSAAQALLGLDRETAEHVFEGSLGEEGSHRAIALKRLDSLLETGTFRLRDEDWDDDDFAEDDPWCLRDDEDDDL